MIRNSKQYRRSLSAALVLVLGMLVPTTTPLAQSGGHPGVVPPNVGYNLLSAKWWQWGLELPVAGHPFNGCGEPGQFGPVLFLAGGPANCARTIPAGRTLFFPLINAECSSLEADPFHGDTAREQRNCAKFWADHIVEASLFCEIDGVPIRHLTSYRFVSPQFAFTAPTPWVYGDVGGSGTAVGDGYYLWLLPLSRGRHKIHFGGDFHFSVAEGDPFDADWGIDTTYDLNVR